MITRYTWLYSLHVNFQIQVLVFGVVTPYADVIMHPDTSLHGVAAQKTTTWIFIDVNTSNLENVQMFSLLIYKAKQSFIHYVD